ncbi:uncharacterized protein [Notamacropus eugenii]|uniref:uncharacterized protein n=1 Tax=Notamacropus eugenii TaxID=9315 RepID=UPI003B66FD6F
MNVGCERRSSLNCIQKMDKLILLLFWFEYIFQTSKSLYCGLTQKQPATIFAEWSEFPKGERPEHYFLKYQPTKDFNKKSVKKISAEQHKLQKSTITVDENEEYNVIIQSVRNGEILSAKSFRTRGISNNNIKVLVTSTSVSFNWSTLPHEFSVSISLNNSSQSIQNNVMFYEWGHLEPSTLYIFRFEFKQLHLDFVNVLQRLDIHVETGM